MTTRIVALALAAALAVIGGAVFEWSAHVASIRALIENRGGVASALLDAGAHAPLSILRNIRAPGLRAIVVDRDTGSVYESLGSGIAERDGAQAAPPPPPPPFDRFIAESAHIGPLRFEGESVAAIVAPDLRAMRTFLIADASVAAVLFCAIAGVAIAASARVQSAQRRRLEAAIEERRAAAAEYQRFLGDAGHELRTPLTIVSGYTDILRKRLGDTNDADLQRILSGMTIETARMRSLVEKMLILARLETPVSVPRLVEANAVALDALEAMRARYPGRDVRLDGSGDACVVIDRDDLYEALHNLVENAIKYAPESLVTVRSFTENRAVRIQVCDFGPGIPESERAMIFERFYRGADRGQAEGSGLGLAIVRRVADRWSGSIDLESRAGMTTFTLTLPLAAVESA